MLIVVVFVVVVVVVVVFITGAHVSDVAHSCFVSSAGNTPVESSEVLFTPEPSSPQWSIEVLTTPAPSNSFISKSISTPTTTGRKGGKASSRVPVRGMKTSTSASRVLSGFSTSVSGKKKQHHSETFWTPSMSSPGKPGMEFLVTPATSGAHARSRTTPATSTKSGVLSSGAYISGSGLDSEFVLSTPPSVSSSPGRVWCGHSGSRKTKVKVGKQLCRM
jgi:hypothetical protein